MDERSERIARRIEPFVLVAAVLTVPTTIVEESHTTRTLNDIATGVNWAIWLIFLLEILVMLAVVPDRRGWLRQHPLELVIVALTAPALLAAVQPIRLLRLLRVLRLLRLAPLMRRALTIDGLRFVGVVAVLTAIAGGAAFASVEKVSVGDGIYWAITTMSTVGYGDIAPKTTEGKIVAVAVMLVGIGTAALAIGAVAQRFVAAEVERDLEQIGTDERELLTRVDEIATQLAVLRDMLAQRAGGSDAP